MARNFSLAVIGDPHLAVPLYEGDERLGLDVGRKLHPHSRELLETTIEEINSHPEIGACLILGDLTRDSESFNHEVARDCLGQLNMPYYIVPGNHDYRRERRDKVKYPKVLHFDRPDFVDYYLGRGLPSRETNYVVQLTGGLALVILDSNLTTAELQAKNIPLRKQDYGWISKTQRMWLSNVLSNLRQAGSDIIVAVHHTLCNQSPAESKGHMLRRFFRHWKLKGARKLRLVLSNYGVRLVLSGHVHAQSVGVEDGITNLVTSASVSYPHAWRALHWTRGAVRVESYPLASIPSVPSLQQQSRQWMNDGMCRMIAEHSSSIPAFERMTRSVLDYIHRTEWWPSFCAGEIAAMDIDDIRETNDVELQPLIIKQVMGLIADYIRWNRANPDPNNLIVEL
jgi:predicted phosphodiesterase